MRELQSPAPVVPAERGARHSAWRRLGMQVAFIGLGLGVGFGGVALYRARTTSHRTVVPSAQRFSFALPAAPLPSVSAPSDPQPAPAEEPTDPAAAVTAFLGAEANGQPQVAWPLLDAASHQRWPTAPSWVAARASRRLPTAFQLAAPSADPVADADMVDVTVDVTRRPSLDPYLGLVAAQSSEVWRVQRENGYWRVAADPVDSRPVLPADTAAPDAVRGWVDSLAACDLAGATRRQAVSPLLGPADVPQAVCQQKGAWSVGAPVTLDRGGDPQPLLAAYGPDAMSWARSVEVRGPDRSFWAEVAPLGDTWMVVGVTVDG